MALPAGYIVRGKGWANPIPQASIEWTYEVYQGDKIVAKFQCPFASWKTYVAAMATYIGTLTTIGMFLKTATARQLGTQLGGALCEVDCTFIQAIESFGDISTPNSIIEESGSVIKASIKGHPNFHAAASAGTPSDPNSPWSQYWSSANQCFATPDNTGGPVTTPQYLWGVEDYTVGSSTVTVTDFFNSEPDSIKGLLGTYAAPPETDPADDDQYLIVSGSRGAQGAWYVRRLVYQYAAQGFSTYIYSSGDAPSGQDPDFWAPF